MKPQSSVVFFPCKDIKETVKYYTEVIGLEVYKDVKGEEGECLAEGGITYVHNTDGGVAFGAEFPNEKNNMHGADEHISIETMKYNLNMYANAIIKICGGL